MIQRPHRFTARVHSLVLALALTAGCATSPAQRPDEPLIEEPRAEEVQPPVTAPGTIRRADLKAFLATSPGAFLAHVDIVPAFQGKSFRGWRVRSFFPGDARLGGVLRADDVVVRVNEQALERPEQLSDVWQAAGARGDLTIDLVREARPMRLAWRIVD